MTILDADQGPLRQTRAITDGAAGVISRVEELAYELRIEEVMTRDVKTVSPGEQMVEVLELFRQNRISGAPVISRDNLVGIISIEDLIRSLRRGDVQAVVVDYMTSELITVRAKDPIVEALKLFSHRRVGRLPVLDEQDRLAGIITKGDITRGILTALQRDYQVEEVRRYRASHLFQDIVSDRTSLILRYKIRQGDFNSGGTASSYIKRALLRLGADPQIARRCGIAIYEAEMNLIIHTNHGGLVRVEIEPPLIVMETTDDGPGIEDVEQALRPGYSTATEAVRELGFGAGMGLTNIRRCVDEMVMESTPGKGTRLEMKINLPVQATRKEPSRVSEEISNP